MRSLDAEAIVVGAGPAGSAAAIELARAGRSVMLLDRAAFPRDKPCGDLIGARAMARARQLGMAETDFDGFPPLSGAIVTADGGSVDLTPNGPGRLLLRRSDARVIPRRHFDAVLVRAAERSGARLAHLKVGSVGRWDGSGRRVEARGPDGAVELAARAVVVAGGYGCRVAPDVAPSMPTESTDEPSRGIAMRGYFGNVAAPPGRIVFCLDRWVLPGYGWVFPLPMGGANVGVGTLVDSAGGDDRDHLRRMYERFTGDPASPAAVWLRAAEAEGTARAWPLDLGPRRRRLVDDGLLVAGEAGALVGPLTGAGIAFALESGAQAGRRLAAALRAGDVGREALLPYQKQVWRAFYPWLRAEGMAQRFLGDPGRLASTLAVVRPLPVTPTLGARLLLHLG